MLREHDVVGSNPALPAFTWQGGVGELLGVARPRYGEIAQSVERVHKNIKICLDMPAWRNWQRK